MDERAETPKPDEGRHTPLPWAAWQLSPDSDPEERHIITASDGDVEVCGIVGNEADAELIVRACNSHDDLINALERAKGCIRRLAAGTPERALAETLAEMDAALAKAKGKSK